MSSLAFVFALHTFRPTPIYVMDEIDAALDFKNVSIVGRFIKERTKNVRFIFSVHDDFQSIFLGTIYRHLLTREYVHSCRLPDRNLQSEQLFSNSLVATRPVRQETRRTQET